jgi:hypothetical protein
MKQFFQRFVRAYQAFKRNTSIIDFADLNIPVFDESKLEDVSEEQKDKLIQPLMLATGKALAVHMMMLKIPSYLSGEFIIDGPPGYEQVFHLRFTRTKRPSHEHRAAPESVD